MAVTVKERIDLKNPEVLLWDDTTTQLSRLWAEGPLVLVFLRHYG